MQCPATIETYLTDPDGRVTGVDARRECRGKLDGPIVNDRTKQVEPRAMGDDVFGVDYLCDTCGQTTLIAIESGSEA